MDWQLLLPTGFVLLASLGFVYAGLAAIFYFRSRGVDDAPRVPVAIVAFALQYFLVFTLTTLGNYVLLPTILLFFTLMALVTAIRLGVQAHSRAGSRIALAGLFTLSAYLLKLGSNYHQFARFYR
jgi:hypothetical protein